MSCFVLCGKMKMFSGETGEKPVRARRRKAITESDLPACRKAGTRHWHMLRRRLIFAEPEYPDDKASRIVGYAATAGGERE